MLGNVVWRDKTKEFFWSFLKLEAIFFYFIPPSLGEKCKFLHLSKLVYFLEITGILFKTAIDKNHFKFSKIFAILLILKY